jgi:anaerobic selenocysteine-containing dehydrogenase
MTVHTICFFCRSDCSYDLYVDLLDDLDAQEEDDIQRAIQESLNDEQIV